MLYAIRDGQSAVTATPATRGRFPTCGGELIARCGEINVWHWGHEAEAECGRWNEPDTSWHIAWKQLMPPDSVEVVIDRNGERHCADIVHPSGRVLLLQATPISPADIRARENFYGKNRMLWLFDLREAAAEGPSGPRLQLRAKTGYHSFRWKHPRKHIGFARAPVLLDLDRGRNSMPPAG